jgi:DNA-binding transcriptional regulator YdaS (Cro superfamily)
VDTPTARQLEYREAVAKHGSHRLAALALGVDKSTISKAISSARRKSLGKAPAVSDACKIMVLPDVQAKPGLDFSFLRKIGMYALEKRPDVIVCIGDFADMPSLSSYDRGTKSFEGRRYKRDIESAQFAMQAFLGPIEEYNKTARRPYKPRKVMTLGNHEQRILRAIEDDAKLDGVLSIKDLAYEEYGWEVYPFLEVVIVNGVAFSHYFTSGTMGRPSSSAAAQLRRANMSCVAGHQQGKQIAYGYRADGSTIFSIICGSCYEHDEGYLGNQGNRHFRGLVMLHEVNDGAADEMWVSLSYINKRYPNVRFETPAYTMPTAEEIATGKC